MAEGKYPARQTWKRGLFHKAVVQTSLEKVELQPIGGPLRVGQHHRELCGWPFRVVVGWEKITGFLWLVIIYRLL